MATWSSKPCNLQNLPRHTPEGRWIRNAVVQMMAEQSQGPDGWDMFTLSTYPAPTPKPNLAVRAAVRRALGLG